MSEDIKQAVRNVFENVWNKGDASAADLIYADTYTAHIANVSSAIRGVEEFKQFVALFRAISPDLCFTIDDQISEGDKVATRWTARLQDKGDGSASDPGGENIVVTGMSIHKMVNGRLVESWDNWDAMTVFQSMGQDVFETLSLNL